MSLPNVLSQGRQKFAVILGFLSLLQVLLAGFIAYFIREIMLILKGGDVENAFTYLWLMLLFSVTIIFIRILERITGEKFGQVFTKVVRKNLYAHISDLPQSTLSKRRNGSLSLRFVGDLTAIKSWVSIGITRLISASILLPGVFIALFYLQPDLALPIFLPLIVAMLVMVVINHFLPPVYARHRKQRAKIANDMSERVPLAPELKLLGRKKYELNRLDDDSDKLSNKAIKKTIGASFLRAVPDLGIASSTVILFVMATKLPSISSADITSTLMLLSIIAIPFRNLAVIFDKRIAWTIAINKCNQTLSLLKIKRKRSLKKIAANAPVSITFKGVSSGLLQRINVTASSGQIIALKGKNGAGKSTILKFAAGLEDPERGKVLFNDIPIKNLSSNQKSKAITYIGGRTPILKGSFRRAVTLGVYPRTNDAKITEAAIKFGLTGLIKQLGGLDGQIDEDGRNLSAGEKRRLLIMRAYLSDCKVLLLDEVDDALDESSAKEVIKHLLTNKKVTTLLISHNSEIAALADTCWYIEKGLLVTTNNHECQYAR